MQLTRRDALAALTSVGVGSVAGCAALPDLEEGEPSRDETELDDETLAVLVAAATVLYPSEVEGVGEFVRTYAVNRVAGDADHRAGLAAAAADLDDVARDWEGSGFATLDRETRDEVLRSVGAAVAAPDPDGTLSSRLRYYVVNDLLYAFYASPTGGRLVGIENPVGYPGGTESYQRPPPRERGDRSTRTEEETDG